VAPAPTETVVRRPEKRKVGSSVGHDQLVADFHAATSTEDLKHFKIRCGAFQDAYRLISARLSMARTEFQCSK
jgi:hypothetical protein